MATTRDISTAILSALTEVGVTGEVIVTGDGSWSAQWIGSPTGDDVQVFVSVLPLSTASDATNLPVAADVVEYQPLSGGPKQLLLGKAHP